MILAVDMGNTNICVGCVDDEKLHFTERISTDMGKTELEYAVLLKTILELYKIDPEKKIGITYKNVEFKTDDKDDIEVYHIDEHDKAKIVLDQRASRRRVGQRRDRALLILGFERRRQGLRAVYVEGVPRPESREDAGEQKKQFI